MPRDDDDDYEDDRPSKKRRGKPNDSDRQMAMFCHLGGIIGGFILPLIIWMTKKDESAYIDEQGKEALNFNITMILGHLVLGVPTCGLAIIVLAPLGIIFSIMGAMAANRGEHYQYPICIRFIQD